jgi:two-component system cell cycle response regulator
MTNQENILETILKSENLPTLPIVASQLIALTSREEATLADISELISKDISLSAKVLKVSNSAFYSFPQQIGSISQAVSVLGINAVRSLVLSFSFLTMRRGKTTVKFDFNTFWDKALASAVGAKLIAGQLKDFDAEQAFISGLLQNLGELILVKTLPEKYEEMRAAIEEHGENSLAVEERILGIAHPRIGAEVAKKWCFPEELTAPVEYHHAPQGYTGKKTAIQTAVNIVYLSDLLVNILYSDKPDHFHKQFRKDSSRLLDFMPSNIEAVLEQFHVEVENAGKYFDFNIKTRKSVQEILQEANIKLSIINLDYDQMNKQLIQAKINLENLTRELERKNIILGNLANIDGLTEVYNHRYFQNALDQEIYRASRNSASLALLMIDIDRFKKFNDTYGHQVGDFVLKQFALCMKEKIRKYDILARYGGEEFSIILPETDLEQACIVAEKLRCTVEEYEFNDNNGSYSLTASFGVASCQPAAVDDFSKDNLISQADQALYLAKEKGRNMVNSEVPKKKWFSLKRTP